MLSLELDGATIPQEQVGIRPEMVAIARSLTVSEADPSGKDEQVNRAIETMPVGDRNQGFCTPLRPYNRHSEPTT